MKQEALVCVLAGILAMLLGHFDLGFILIVIPVVYCLLVDEDKKKEVNNDYF